jgi:DNA-binding MurR/RpiR family transcriptional regulator
MEYVSPGQAVTPEPTTPMIADPHVLFVADNECSDLADHYRLKLTVDGYRVTMLAAEHLTAQHVRELDPDVVYLEIQRLTPRTAAVWAKIRWARGNKRIPIVVLSPKRREALARAGVDLDWCDHLVDWSRSRSLSPNLAGRPS